MSGSAGLCGGAWIHKSSTLKGSNGAVDLIEAGGVDCQGPGERGMGVK